MQKNRVTILLGVLGVVALASCGSGGSKSSSSPTSGGSSKPAASAPGGGPPASSEATAGEGGGGWPGVHGCDSPSAVDVGDAFGSPIVKSLNTADDGCLWETATRGRGVQVSYHTADQDPMTPAMLNFFHSSPGVTDVSVPGASQAFIRDLKVANIENPVAYVTYPEGTVQIAFSGAPGSLPEKNLEAVVRLITG